MSENIKNKVEKRKNKTLIIIPAHNEEQSIYDVVTGALKYADVSVTDDGSQDSTPEILKKIKEECQTGKHNYSLHIITHEKATHIPKGLQDGFKYGVSKNYDFFITMDAGMSHNPEALPDFLRINPAIDVVAGSRNEKVNVPLYRRIISRAAALVVNYALSPSFLHFKGPDLHDTTSGFRRYSRKVAEIISKAELKSKSFDFHMEALALSVRSGGVVAEIPITYEFSNSSFNLKVLKQAFRYALHLLRSKASYHKVSFRRMAFFFFLFYGTATAGILYQYEWNPSVLIRFGHDYVAQNEAYTPEGAVRMIGNEAHGGNGYDGQIFYYYARTLFEPGAWPEGFNNAYRAPRIGYPFLAALFSVFGSWGTVAGMILVQIGFILFGIYCMHQILPPDRKYLSLFLLFSPFALQSFLVLVSDAVMVSLALAGFFFLLKMRGENFRQFLKQPETENRLTADPLLEEESKSQGIRSEPFAKRSISIRILFSLLAWGCMSLAIMTKESSLAFLFPLGLYVLLRKQWVSSLLILASLLPVILWQIYLAGVHGMVPAGVLSVFFSPLDGILGLLSETFREIQTFIQSPSAGQIGVFLRLSVRLLLLILIITALISVLSGKLWNWTKLKQSEILGLFPFRLAVALALFSVIIADYYYFWSVYENISRMFTILIPVMILHYAADKSRKAYFFFATLLILAFLVWIRATLMTPAFPFDIFRTL